MVGFDIGGTKCAVCVGYETENGLHIADKRVIPTDLGVSPYVMLERMCVLAETLTRDFSRIGISCGGPLNSKTGRILSPPNLRGWDNVEIVDYLSRRYGSRVCLQNDANACAVAEWKYGAGKGTENMIFLTFGTGLGAGLILDGRLYSGTCDMAGEVGHIRLSEFGPVGYGKAGSMEGFCSGGGIAQLGRMLAMERFQQGREVSYCSGPEQLDQITAKTVADQARQGKSDALKVYELCGEKLGRGLAVLVDILNPQRIVIGSVYQRCEDLLKTAMLQTLRRECLPLALEVCQVAPAALGDMIGDYAALAVAAL